MRAKCVGLVCRECGKQVGEKTCAQVCPDCGSPMRVVFEPESLAQAMATVPVKSEESLLKRWAPILPISEPELIDKVSLGEVETRLLPSRKIGPEKKLGNLYFKIEQGPTLSLKDRGTSLCVLKALEYGFNTVCVASSGNNAASVSAYGARAGLKPVVFVQKNVSQAKVCKSVLYGGKVIRIDGDMATASGICNEMVRRHNWFQCGGPNPYRIVSKRTFAYGLVEQLGREPDVVLVPCGGGAGLVAAHDAFSEMREAGVIKKMPRLVAVQLEACAPIASAYRAGADEVKPVEKKPSLSDAVMNANPYWGKYCLRAIRDTGGTAITVSDDDFIQAIRKLGSAEGIFVEPAAAATVAALDKLRTESWFDPDQIIVCNLTGHGLNMPSVAASDSDMPELTPAKIEDVEKELNNRKGG